MAGRPVHTFEVVRSEQLAPHLVRVILGGGGFDTFKPNDFTDAYVKIVFVTFTKFIVKGLRRRLKSRMAR